MHLDELLVGDEDVIHGWLDERGLIHECDCGYSVYDSDEVNAAVQGEWGDSRCNEIFDWACNLSNRFGWLFLESAQPEYDIYHCQHCIDSEWSLLMDMEKIAEAAPRGHKSAAGSGARPVGGMSPSEPVVVFVDESYSNGFPRKAGGSLAYAALIVPESAVAGLYGSVDEILKNNYRGTPPTELKYSQISRRPRLLEGIGRDLTDMLCGIPGAAIIGLFVPQEGFFGEKVRSVEAIAKYDLQSPDPAEIEEITSATAVDEAVRTAANSLAQTVGGCIAAFSASRAPSATVYFDPRTSSLDLALQKGLESFLPLMPIDVPAVRHGDAIVTTPPSADMARLGNKIQCRFDTASEHSPGLQIADFLAGDIRRFFEENDELLRVNTSSQPLINKRALFPQAFQASRVPAETLRKARVRTGTAFLPVYRTILAQGVVSYYATNGQMRHFNIQSGEVYDMMD